MRRLILPALALLVFVGGYLRCTNLKWDYTDTERNDSTYQHSDERNIVHATERVNWSNVTLDADSSLYPDFFAYGTFPFYVSKMVAQALAGLSGRPVSYYSGGTLNYYGRLLSGIYGTLAILFIYLLAGRLFGRRVGMLSAFFMAFAFHHIQSSHYSTVETLLVVELLFVLYLCWRWIFDTGAKAWLDAVAIGVVLGAALATKFSALTFLAPVGVAWLSRMRVQWEREEKSPAVRRRALVAQVVLVLTLAYSVALTVYPVLVGFHYFDDVSAIRDPIAREKRIELGRRLDQWLGPALTTPRLAAIPAARWKAYRAGQLTYDEQISYGLVRPGESKRAPVVVYRTPLWQGGATPADALAAFSRVFAVALRYALVFAAANLLFPVAAAWLLASLALYPFRMGRGSEGQERAGQSPIFQEKLPPDVPSPAGKSAPVPGLVERALAGPLIILFLALTVAFTLAPMQFIRQDKWKESIRYEGRVVGGPQAEGDVPYTRQFAGTVPYFFQLKNLVDYSLGEPLGLLGIAGLLAFIAFAAYRWGRRGDITYAHWLLLSWALPYFYIVGGWHAKFLRYMMPLYPFFIMGAAWLLVYVWDRFPRRRWRVVTGLVGAGTMAFSVFYAFALQNMFSHLNTRMAASNWLYENAPRNARVVKEHWDDQVPLPTAKHADKSPFSYFRLSSGDSDLQMYNEDIEHGQDRNRKLSHLVTRLSNADYIVWSSKRLYGSILRLPNRYPTSGNFYRLLFTGVLGFELVHVETNYPRLWGIVFNDDLVEESAHCYDHPKVTIFKKVREVPPEQLRQYLLSPPPEAARITLTDVLKHQEGRSIFDRTARHPGRRWFFFFQLLALVGFPIVFMFARHLPDAGWGLSRPLAMLLLGYGAWIIPSLGWAPFSRGLTLALFAVILGASAYAAWRQRAAIAEAITQRWKWMLGCELVYLAIFGFYLTIRMHNPDVYWGEKPMDLSFLAATYRSEYFPLRDPWYAGHAVNYYYLGHTLVAATGKLLNIGVEFLYNLAAATVPALVGAAAFSIILHACRRAWAATAGAYLLTVGGSLWSAAIWFYNHSPQFRTDNSRYHELARRVFVDGNVDWSAAFGHLWQILKSGVIFYSGPPIQEARFDDGFFWRAGHDIIPNTRTAANEFPSWTYLFADLHAHMLVMPLVLLFIGTALAMLGLPADRRPHRRWCALGCLSLTLGAIICVNTWDLPASALLLLFVLLWQMFHVKHSNQLPLNAGTWGRRALLAAGNLGFSVILPLGMVVIGAFALYAPFHVNFVSRVEVGLGAVQRSWGSNTPPDIFALIFGAMLFFVAWYLIARLWQPNIEEDATACSLLNEGGWVGSNAAASSRSPRSLLNKGGWGGSPEADVWRARFIRLCLFAALLLFGLLASRYYSLPSVRQALVNIHHLTHPVTLDYRLLALLLPFVVWAMWYGLASRRPGEAATAALAWVGLGIAAGVEFFFIQETWGYPEHRYNTVFKFYLQVWTYLALAAGAAMGLLIRFRSRPESDDLPAQARRLGRTALVLFGFGVLLPLTLVFPIVGSYTITRGIGSKTNNGDIPGLDGLSWFKKQDPDNYWAMKWLTFNIPGQPTVLEAPGTSYWHETSRISTMTGLPTILGWPHHSKERSHPDPEVSQRERDAIAIYSSQDKRRVVRLLQDYGVDYIYVGAQELRRFGNVHRKFSRYGDVLDVVYRRGEVGVYQVRRNLSAEYMTEVEEVAPADEPAQAGMSLLEGGDGFGYGQFREPRGIRFDGSRFFVADTFNHRVQVFAPDGKFLFAFGESGGGESQFREPNDVITDASGRIIVLDTWNGRIQVFDPKGRFAAVWTEGIGYGPRAIARDPASGRLYLADTGNGQVRMLSPEGGLLRVYGERGAGPGRFSNPTGIAFHDGRVYVLDRDNRRVVVLDAELRYLADWPVDYPPGDLMGEPKLAVTPEGRVLVSDAFKGRILVYDPDGRPVAVLGTGQLVAPTGLTLGPGGLVYASDMRAHRILALRLPQ